MDSFPKDRPHYTGHGDLAQFEALNTPLWIFDVDHHTMWWANRRALDFWRAESLDALLARDYSSDSETVRTRLRQLVEGPVGPGRIQETWTLYPEERPITVVSDMQPVLIEEGRHAVMIEASQTLDLQSDPDALRILEVARSSALMVSSFTMSGQLLTQNPASYSCYANPKAEPAQGDLSDRFEDVSVGNRILSAVEKDGHFEAELTVQTRAGERIHRVSARKGRDPVTGEFVTVLNEEDMTDQVMLRKKLQDLNTELEERVAERTKSLQSLNESLELEIKEREAAEEKLRHAQKMEAIGKLTGGVAHDFNNLFAVILGNAEILREEQGTNSEPLDYIVRATERGSELTQRLLAYSRQQPLRPRAFNPGELAAGLSELLANTLGQAIDLRTVAPYDLWDVMADASQVENALLNLTLNARDAMPGGGTLTVECKNVALHESDAHRTMQIEPGDYVVLAVSDNGTGMLPETRERAFEPFFTTKDVGEGSGLGLSMVYGFARQSGGHAAIYSEAGHGTTVKLYLPRAASTDTKPHDARRASLPQGESETILVIEDDPEVRKLSVRMLESLNYRTIAVADARAAEKTLCDKAQPVDLVLSDVVLPGGKSGPELAAQIRTQDATMKFLFMSGYPAEASRRNGLLDPSETLLSKPFRRHQLAEAVSQALR